MGNTCIPVADSLKKKKGPIPCLFKEHVLDTLLLDTHPSV